MTHLAVALATLAVEAGYRDYFTTADDMVRRLLAAERDGNFTHKLRTYTAPTVLVVDDVGLLPVRADGARVFFNVINARYENGHPTLATTNRGARCVGGGVRRCGRLGDPGPPHAPGPSCPTSRGPRGACVSTRHWPRR